MTFWNLLTIINSLGILYLLFGLGPYRLHVGLERSFFTRKAYGVEVVFRRLYGDGGWSGRRMLYLQLRKKPTGAEEWAELATMHARCPHCSVGKNSMTHGVGCLVDKD